MDILTIEEFEKVQYERRLKKHAIKTVRFIKACKSLDLYYLAVTLSFKDWDEFNRCKKEQGFSKYLERLVKYCKDHKFELVAYLWVMEFQMRGVPHYHVLIGFKQKDVKIPFPDLQHGWDYGFSNVKRLKKEQLNKNYLANYLKKDTQKSYNIYKAHEIELYKTRFIGVYIKREYRQHFFECIISSYAGWHYKLCKIFGCILRRVRDVVNRCSYVLLEYYNLKIRRLYEYIFSDGLVTYRDNGFLVNDKYYSVSDFWAGIEFLL